MNHRADYLLQILEKIGAPLASSVIEANARAGNSETSPLHAEAQAIAALLAKSVQTGIEMGRVIDLGPTGEMTDSLRLALTGLAGPLIAGFFKNAGRAPADVEIKRIITALQAVLTFGENFAADSDHADRLRHIGADGTAVDPAQTQVQYIQAFTPVINAISAFPFGQPEQKLIMEVSGRLTDAASRLRATIPGSDRRTELGILRALAEIYAACHEAETARIMNMNEQQRAGAPLSIEQVWQAFEMRRAMVEALATGMLGQNQNQSVAGGGGQTPAPPPQQPVASPPATPSSAAPQTSPPPADANPLSMFAKKPADTPAPPPAQNPPNASSSPPPATLGGSPMSFFKTPKTEE